MLFSSLKFRNFDDLKFESSTAEHMNFCRIQRMKEYTEALIQVRRIDLISAACTPTAAMTTTLPKAARAALPMNLAKQNLRIFP